MNVRGPRALAVCCAVLGAQGAAAQDGAQEAQPAARWSIGAGVGFSGVSLAGLTPLAGGPGGSLGVLQGVAGRASLEYLLGENLALVLGGAGSYVHTTSELSLAEEQPEPQDAYGASVNVGLRRYVAGAGATRFSVHGLVNLGFARRDYLVSGALLVEERTRGISVSAGFAVEHALLERLLVRVGTEVLSVGHTGLRQTGVPTSGEPEFEQRTDATGASLVLSPSIELRLAF